ncbi:hypothetical protein [Undibacterium sp.]|uniref:hypothetical protein n=1 Tax=Undibacterium sp. TaxID=1914977 RepID=UPI003751C5EF
MSTAVAQNKSKVAKKNSLDFLEVPFNIDSQKLKWTGEHDISKVIAAIKKIDFKKDQFETTAAYLARTENPQIFSMPINSLLGFSFSFQDPGTPSQCYTKYDADKLDLIVECLTSTLQRIYSPEKEKFIETFTFSKVTTTDGKSYVGENNFGVKRRISVRTAKGLGLAIRNLEGIAATDFRSGLLKIELRLPNFTQQTAKANMDDIGLLFIGELESPYLLRESKAEEPTIDRPIDYRGDFQYLNMFMREVWVVNIRTKEILQRFDRSKTRLE